MNTTSSITIAVISDLHCTSQKGTQRITHLHGELTPVPKNRHPVESLKSLSNINADYLICTGDIADKGDCKGYYDGMRYIQDLQKKLGAKKMIVLNGNHDINLNEKDTCRHMKDFDCDIFNDSKYWSNHYKILEDDNLIFLTLDTSFHITNTESLNTQPSFDHYLFQKLNDELSKLASSDKIKIALCHHHPINHSDMDDIYKKNDVIDRGDTLLDLLKKNDFDLIIHGHKHFPKIRHYEDLVIFCAGSFASLENVIEYGHKNTFHILELNKVNHNCQGIIRTWVFSHNAGWKQPDTKTLFPAKTGFGYHEKNVKALADELIQKNQKWYCEENYNVHLLFADILKQFPALEFLDPFQQEEFETYLRERWKITIYPSLLLGADHLCKMLTD